MLSGFPRGCCHSKVIYTECFTSGEYTRFKILAANASIDLWPQRIFEYLSEAIRLKYARPRPYVELRTSNLSSLGCIFDDVYYSFM
jgi:hypothetical protein